MGFTLLKTLAAWLFVVHISMEMMDFGEWTENSRGTYKKWGGFARATTQVFPGAWTAILISLDNVGVWNLRTENLDSWYLGQETYIKIVDPKSNSRTEFLRSPLNTFFCGPTTKLQIPSAAATITGDRSKLIFSLFVMVSSLYLKIT